MFTKFNLMHPNLVDLIEVLGRVIILLKSNNLNKHNFREFARVEIRSCLYYLKIRDFSWLNKNRPLDILLKSNLDQVAIFDLQLGQDQIDEQFSGYCILKWKS